MQVVEDCSETDGVHSAGTKAKLSIYLSMYVNFVYDVCNSMYMYVHSTSQLNLFP